MSLAAPAPRAVLRANLSRDDLMMRAGVVALAGVLLLIVGLPLWALLAKGFEDRDGHFVGLANYLSYFSTPALFNSALNSFHVAAAATLIVVPLAFLYAYALTRTMLPARWLFQGISLIPIFAPSLLPGLALVYLFGNQGFFKGMLGGPIYGFDGILIAQVFYCFPHATLILVTALATADARLYEAADALGASKLRVFFTVTLPGAKYGLISAALVVFTLVITDFGIAKVIGGNFNVLATDVYKQVIGQQNFSMGAVVGMVLLAPAALAFVVDRFVQRKQVALLTARAVPLDSQAQVRPRRLLHRLLHGDLARHPGHPRHGGVGLADQVLAVQSQPDACQLPVRQFRRQRLGLLLQLAAHGGGGGGLRHGADVRRRLAQREDQGFRRGARRSPAAGLPAHGGARHRARPGLHLLLQRAQQPAQLPLRHHGDPGDQHRGALLHGGPSHGDDGAEADRPRVRNRSRPR